MRKIVVVLLVVGLLVLGTVSIFQVGEKAVQDVSNTDDQFAEVRSQIIEYMGEAGVPSISVAVAEDGEIIWEESFGWADRENHIEATPHTMYRLASISKVVTTTGLMVLVERGLVDLDQPANTYLGEAQLHVYEGESSEATVERILHHTAGLPMYWDHFYEYEPYEIPCIDETVKRYGIVVFPPGEKFTYSNLGFGVIECIIEKVSKKSYPEFMKTEVFEPLGLTRTAVITAPYDEDYIAKNYSESGTVLPFYDNSTRGAGSVYSSAHDLIRFGMFHLKNNLTDKEQILSDKTIDEMQNTVDPVSTYTLSWDVTTKYGYRIVRHGGGAWGARTSLQLIPSENIAVCVLCNGWSTSSPDDGITPRICDWIFAALLPDYKKKVWDFSNFRIRKSNKFMLPSELTGEWEGEIKTYEGTIPIQLTIEENGDVWMKFLNDPHSEGKGKKPESFWPAQFENGIFSASFDYEIPTEDTARHQHFTHVQMTLHGERLSGFAVAESFGFFFAYPSYIELKKIEGISTPPLPSAFPRLLCVILAIVLITVVAVLIWRKKKQK